MWNLFSRAGNVKRVNLMRAKKPQECKNYGYVCTRIVVSGVGGGGGGGGGGIPRLVSCTRYPPHHTVMNAQ